ncbi:MAG: DUF1800 family protein [Bacteroidota bacterium]
MPITPLSGPLGVKRAAHLLRRTCLGGTRDEIDDFATLTAVEAVERLFSTELPRLELPVNPDPGNEDVDMDRVFLQWHLGQMLGSGVDASSKFAHIFRERLVFFFHTHFTTKRSVVRNHQALFYQQELFRLFAFDEEDIILPPEDPEADPDDPASMETIVPRNIKNLTKKICVDNAMLIFLDGRFNVKGSVNENFARELMELYSVGRGLEGNIPAPEFDGDYFLFTEQDVQEGAKVLSGFNVDTTFTTIDEETGIPRGSVRGNENNASQHEEGDKSFSIRLASGVVSPDPDLLTGGRPTKESMLDEISQLVDLIYEQDETPVAICRELYRFFVYHDVTPELQASTIQDMADILSANEFKIQPVLEALFTSTHFYEADAGADDNNFGALIKSPIEVVLGFVRNFGLQLPDYETQLDAFYEYTGGLLGAVRNQGMDYYEPFEVAGYAAYHQYPIFNRSWITTNYLANRYNFIQERISEVAEIQMGQVDIVAYVRENYASEAPSARDLVIAVAEHFLPVTDNLSFDASTGELTVERLNYFLTVFLGDLDPDPEASWNVRWTNGVDPTTVARQLSSLFNAMLQSPEYQLM